MIVEGRNNIVHGIRSTDRLNITTEAGPTFTYFPNMIHVHLRNRYKFGFLQVSTRQCLEVGCFVNCT